MFLVDTREKNALFENSIILLQDIVENNLVCQRCTLNVGDYTTEKLINLVHAERKNPNDLYGSIVQSHKRFVREILRAQDKKILLYIFVECSIKDFISKKWDIKKQRKMNPCTLASILNTMIEKYNLKFIWCENREEMKTKLSMWFSYWESMLQNNKGINPFEFETKVL